VSGRNSTTRPSRPLRATDGGNEIADGPYAGRPGRRRKFVMATRCRRLTDAVASRCRRLASASPPPFPPPHDFPRHARHVGRGDGHAEVVRELGADEPTKPVLGAVAMEQAHDPSHAAKAPGQVRSPAALNPPPTTSQGKPTLTDAEFQDEKPRIPKDESP
jgi:hypothetical protein